MKRTTLLFTAVACLTGSAFSKDWTTWGGDASRNMVSGEKGLPTAFSPGKKKSGTEEIDLASTKDLLWVAKLGSEAYGTVTISDGKVFVGTNNEVPRNPEIKGDRGVLMTFKEDSGEFLWQLNLPKLGTGKVSDWEFLGICSTPTVIGKKGYLVTNRADVVCIDIDGFANVKSEELPEKTKQMTKLMTAPPAPGQPPPVPVVPGAKDGNILWRVDLREEFGVFPHNITSSYTLALGDHIWATTSNGVDWTHTNIPAPNAPSLVCLNAKDGSIVGEMDSEASKGVLHSNWSSPAGAMVDGKEMCIFGAGNGFVYALGAETTKKEDINTLKEYWKYDANPPEYRTGKDGKPIKYALYEGPSEVIATPVVWKDKVYASIGQDPEHGEGVGMLSCLDIKTGKPKWVFKEIQRTLSTASISDDGLLFIGDHTGRVFCLNAETGEKYWMHDTKGHIWGSSMLVDGKVYIGNEEGELTILEASKNLKVVGTVEFPSGIYSTPIAANGKLFVSTQSHLFCFKTGAKPLSPISAEPKK